MEIIVIYLGKGQGHALNETTVSTYDSHLFSAKSCMHNKLLQFTYFIWKCICLLSLFIHIQAPITFPTEKNEFMFVAP